MIVDCYTHTWESPDQLGRALPRTGYHPPLPEFAKESGGAGRANHAAACEPVDCTIVLGFRSAHLEAEISNDAVAAYVRTNPEKLIGFAGIDPKDPKAALIEMQRARTELSMPGLAVAPAAQDFHPTNSQAMQVYAAAAEARMPIVFHSGIYVGEETRLEYARPFQLDEVARENPPLKMIVAHMGYPWVQETLMLLAKHRNVYAEISWILHQPWQAYQALLSAHQFGVMDKLLFGSGFPSSSASACIEQLYSINSLVHGTSLPTIPREALRGIVERDALSILGIAGRRETQPADDSDAADTADELRPA